MKKTSTRKFAATALALATAAALCVPATAFAAGNVTGNRGETTAKLKVEAGQIQASVPTEITGAINADGSITYATGAQIQNLSVFSIKVSTIAGNSDETAFNLVAQTAFGGSSAANALYTTVKPSTATNTVDLVGGTPAAVDWTIAKDTSLGLVFAGAAKNISNAADFADHTAAYKIVWTVAAAAAV